MRGSVAPKGRVRSTLKLLAETINLPMLTVFQALEGHDSVPFAVRQRVLDAASAMEYTLHITIRDVAALAAVSVGTVSHVINGHTRTRPETRQRVLQAISDLSYRPNSIARGLKSNHTRLIGYGWHRPEDPVRPNALLDRFLYEMAQSAEVWGYHILTFAQSSQMRNTRYDELMQMARIDGLVLSDISYNDERVGYLMQSGIPFVTFGRANSSWDVPSVDVDGRVSMRLAVEHLIDRGHTQIGMLAWPEGMRIGDVRVQGYCDALEAAGIPLLPPLLVRVPNAVDQALLATQRLMAAQPRPTAIACANDVMAFGARRYLDQVGLHVGVDIALTGYDDSPIAELLELTSVRQPVDTIAARVIEILIGEIEAAPVARRNVTLAPSLTVRASSRRPLRS